MTNIFSAPTSYVFYFQSHDKNVLRITKQTENINITYQNVGEISKMKLE